MLSSVNQSTAAKQTKVGIICAGPNGMAQRKPALPVPTQTGGEPGVLLAEHPEIAGFEEMLADPDITAAKAKKVRAAIAKARKMNHFEPDVCTTATHYANIAIDPDRLQRASSKRKDDGSFNDKEANDTWMEIANDPLAPMALDFIEADGKYLLTLRVQTNINPELIKVGITPETAADAMRLAVIVPSIGRTAIFSSFKNGLYEDTIQNMGNYGKHAANQAFADGLSGRGFFNPMKVQQGEWQVPDGFSWCLPPKKIIVTRKDMDAVKTREIEDLRTQLHEATKILTNIASFEKNGKKFVMAGVGLAEPTLTRMGDQWLLTGELPCDSGDDE